MRTAIVWFKTDLRLTDNETLIKAIAQNNQIVPVYCFDESHFKNTDFGFKKMGSYRAQFLLESLEDLATNLKILGSNLVILFGKPEVELPKIAKSYQAQKVFAKKEVAYEEKLTESLVQQVLWKQGCELETYSTSTLYHAQDLPFAIKDIPDIFTNFRKKVEKESQIRAVFEKPISIQSPKLPECHLPDLKTLGLSKKEIDTRAVLQFKGGETQAIKRLNYYFFESQCLSDYKLTRNGLIGADYSSKFSPWLALGCISPRTIFYEIKKYEKIYKANDSTYWLEFELLWRDFFRFMFKKHQTKLFQQAGIHQEKTISKKLNKQLLQEWIDGKTKQDFVNANMLELKKTGFMSNRGRQNVASYFCHDLKLDWRFGAAYFEQELIDYDVSSNWGNWAYIAGVGNDPRPDRIFNIEKQAQDYDKKGLYRKLWL
jgi:deoxyribodipyrimidine photo-lyase